MPLVPHFQKKRWLPCQLLQIVRTSASGIFLVLCLWRRPVLLSISQKEVNHRSYRPPWGPLVAAGRALNRAPPANLIEASGRRDWQELPSLWDWCPWTDSEHISDLACPKGCELVRKTNRTRLSTMKDLNYQLKALCRNNRDGSHATRKIRECLLSQMADQLYALGYRRLGAHSLKPKHVEALVSLWKNQGLGIGTLKNRLAVLRWWAGKVNRANVVARDNGAYGIGERQYVAQTSKAQDLDPGKLAKIKDPYLRLSLRLQAEFGLRREEAIKFRPGYAVRQDHIRLKASWTKGGRARSVPITRESQRQLLEEIQRLAGGGALIPPDRNYVQQLRCYESQTKAAEFRNLHGLRHAYAQRRYRELTGWPAPVAGGPARKVLAPEQHAMDEEARATVTAELGHTRLNITNSYLGR